MSADGAATRVEPARVMVGVIVPCRDAERRVWQAIELARRSQPHLGKHKSIEMRQDSQTVSYQIGGRGQVTLAALYARVSTDKQEREATIQSQLDALQRAAREREYAVLPEHVFVDERSSGARLDRPGLDRLRDLAAEAAFEVVLVAAPDRLARQYAYQVVVLDELTRAGCEVIFLNHTFDRSPEQQMLLQIQGVFAEYERYAEFGISFVMPPPRLCRAGVVQGSR